MRTRQYPHSIEAPVTTWYGGLFVPGCDRTPLKLATHSYPAPMDIAAALRLLERLHVPEPADAALVDLLQAVSGSASYVHLEQYRHQTVGLIRGLRLGEVIGHLQAEQLHGLLDDLAAYRQRQLA